MKQLFASLIITGYLGLLPFCFFGGALVASADTAGMSQMNMSGMAMNAMSSDQPMPMKDCGIPAGCPLLNGGAVDSFMHHFSMYVNLSQAIMTVVFALFALLATFLLIHFSTLYDWLLSWLKYRPKLQVRSSRKTTHSIFREQILNWLALFESSPNAV